MRPNFRIIYLKNEDNRKYNDEKIKKNSNIVPSRENNSKNNDDSLVPNLVHLSARLQDDTYEEKRTSTLSNKKLKKQFDNHSQNPILNFPDNSIIHNKGDEINQNKQLQIKKFIELKELSLQKYKNTMKNLIGPVNFPSNRKRQKKISRLIQQTIKDVCSSERQNKSKQRQQSQTISLSQNRNLLESDFQNFLIYKNDEKYRKIQDPEEFKLKRLSMVNPEKQISHSIRPTTIQPLNLFHFLHQKPQEKMNSFDNRSRNFSSSNVATQSNLAKTRLDKKIFKLQINLKTSQYQFQWSRINERNAKDFTFRTLDL